jgi:hypothetical protein
MEFIPRGDFALASGQKVDGSYDRIWFNEPISMDEISFESGVFLLLKGKAKALIDVSEQVPGSGPEHVPGPKPEPGPILGPGPKPEPEPVTGAPTRKFHISGDVPPETWNRLGTKILPKLRSGSDLKIGIEFTVTLDNSIAQNFEADLRQILNDLGLSMMIRIE